MSVKLRVLDDDGDEILESYPRSVEVELYYQGQKTTAVLHHGDVTLGPGGDREGEAHIVIEDDFSP